MEQFKIEQDEMLKDIENITSKLIQNLQETLKDKEEFQKNTGFFSSIQADKQLVQFLSPKLKFMVNFITGLLQEHALNFEQCTEEEYKKCDEVFESFDRALNISSGQTQEIERSTKNDCISENIYRIIIIFKKAYQHTNIFEIKKLMQEAQHIWQGVKNYQRKWSDKSKLLNVFKKFCDETQICFILFYFFDLKDQAYEKMDSLISNKPNDTINYYKKSEFLYNQGRFGECIKILLQGLEINPVFQDSHYLLMECYIKSKKEDLAMQQIEKVYAKNSNNPLFIRDFCLMIQKKFDVQEIYFKMLDILQDLEPKENILILNARGLVYLKLDKIEEAMKCFEKIGISEDPVIKEQSLLSKIGVQLYQREFLKEALIVFRLALKKSPEEKNAIINLADTIQEEKEHLEDIGEDQDVEAKNQEIEQILENGLKIYPGDMGILQQMALFQKSIDNFEKSIEYLAKAVETDPLNIETLQELASIYRDLGQNELSVEFYKKILIIKPNCVDSLEQLAQIDTSVNPIEHYLKILKIQPTHEYALSFVLTTLIQLKKIRSAIAFFKASLLDQNSEEIQKVFVKVRISLNKKLQELGKPQILAYNENNTNEQQSIKVENVLESSSESSSSSEEEDEQFLNEEQRERRVLIKKQILNAKIMQVKIFDFVQNQIRKENYHFDKFQRLKIQIKTIKDSNLWKRLFRKDINYELAEFLQN